MDTKDVLGTETLREEQKDSTGFYVLEQSYSGWAGSGFERKFIELKARAVDSDGRKEVQISVHSTEVKKSGRGYSSYASLTLTPEQAGNLISAITFK